MKIRRLRLENYRRHRDVDLELPDGVLAIVGPNGSGKSSILEAIGFALFGTQATRTPKALLRHTEAAPSDPVRVTLQMELAGQALEVVREFRGLNLTAHAHLSMDGKPLVSGGASSHAAVTEEVERLLGMDRAAFFTSIVAQQKELSRLADLKPAERKQLILRLLGIDAVDRAIDDGRARRRQADQRVQDLRETMPDLEALRAQVGQATQAVTAAEADVTRCAASWKQAKKAMEQAEATYQARQAQHDEARAARHRLETAQADLAARTQQAKDLEARIQAARQAQDEATSLHEGAARRGELAEQVARGRQAAARAEQAQAAAAELQALERRLAGLAQDTSPQPLEPLHGRQNELSMQLDEAVNQRAGVAARLGQARDHLAQLESTDTHTACPFCEQPLTEALPRLQARLTDEQRALNDDLATAQARADALAHARQATDARIKELEAAHRAHERREAERRELTERVEELRPRAVPVDVPDLADLEAQLTAAEAAERNHIRAMAQAEALPDLVDQARGVDAAIRTASQAIEGVQQELAAQPDVDVAAAQAAWRAAQSAEREAERAHLDATAKHQLAAQALAHTQARQEDGQAAKAHLDVAQRDLRLWTALAGGRNSGLLEAFRTHIVGKIRPAINAEASRLLARFTDGRYRELILDEEYGVFVVDEGVPYTLDRFSGGESDLAHLALRLAVSRLLTRRSGAPELRFLALDEVFGSLDRQRRDAVVSALHSLEDMYSQVVLVTHQEDLHESLDAVLEVRRVGDASEVRFHHG